MNLNLLHLFVFACGLINSLVLNQDRLFKKSKLSCSVVTSKQANKYNPKAPIGHSSGSLWRITLPNCGLSFTDLPAPSLNISIWYGECSPGCVNVKSHKSQRSALYTESLLITPDSVIRNWKRSLKDAQPYIRLVLLNCAVNIKKSDFEKHSISII